jgi:hypothetical protein
MPPDLKQNRFVLPSGGIQIGGMSQEDMTYMNQYLGQQENLQAFEPSAQGYTTIALVVAVVPFSNLYLIQLSGSGSEKKVAHATYGGSNRLNGANFVSYFLPGTYVTVFIRGSETDIKLPHCTILGAVDPLIGLDDDMRHVFDTPTEFLSHSSTTASTAIETKMAKRVTTNMLEQTNYNYGKPMDGMPGEQVLYNLFGGGLLVTDFMTVMKGSEGARIECYMFDDTIRITAKQYMLQNAMYDERMFFNRFGLSRIKNMSLNLAEGLGSLGVSTNLLDVKTKDDATEGRIHSNNPEAIGYFNYNHIEGNLGDGSYEYITYPPKGEVFKGDEVIPPGLLSIEKGYDGSFRVKAAREISLQKTMYIVAPKEIIQSNGNSKEEGIDSREDWETSHNPVESLAFLGQQFVGTWADFQREHALGDMRKQKDFWIIPDKKGVYDAFNAATGASFKDEEEFQALPEDQPHYVTPARQAVITPFAVDGKRSVEYNVYDTTSGIEMLPDGSVVFHGGNGEEIKMYKGNIYITCPGDIIYQAGRDIISMAPRNNIVKANKGSLELTSNNGASMIAKGNLQLCAASDGVKGTLVIENKSPYDLDVKTFEEGDGLNINKATGGGVFIKSATRAALLGKNTYMGAGNSFSGSVAEVDAQSTEFHSDSHKHYVEQIMSFMNRQGSALSLGGSNIELLSANGITMSGNLALTTTHRNIPYVTREGESPDVAINTGDSNIQVDGGIFASGNVSALAVAAYSSTQISPIKDREWDKAIHSMLKEANVNTYGNISSKAGLAYYLNTKGESLADLDKISAIMPSVEAYKTANFYFPFSTWQSILTGGSTWTESEIKGVFTSMAFPGYGRWSESGSLKGFKDNDVENKTLSSDYKINC